MLVSSVHQCDLYWRWDHLMLKALNSKFRGWLNKKLDYLLGSNQSTEELAHHAGDCLEDADSGITFFFLLQCNFEKKCCCLLVPCLPQKYLTHRKNIWELAMCSRSIFQQSNARLSRQVVKDMNELMWYLSKLELESEDGFLVATYLFNWFNKYICRIFKKGCFIQQSYC